jgi:hypothetical protein
MSEQTTSREGPDAPAEADRVRAKADELAAQIVPIITAAIEAEERDVRERFESEEDGFASGGALTTLTLSAIISGLAVDTLSRLDPMPEPFVVGAFVGFWRLFLDQLPEGLLLHTPDGAEKLGELWAAKIAAAEATS